MNFTHNPRVSAVKFDSSRDCLRANESLLPFASSLQPNEHTPDLLALLLLTSLEIWRQPALSFTSNAQNPKDHRYLLVKKPEITDMRNQHACPALEGIMF
jgi:hypothetical protein